jgi:hypothetical protein
MKKIIICLLVFAVGLYGSALQAQILSVGEGTEFSIGAGTTVSALRLEFTPSALYSFSNNTLTSSIITSNSTSYNHIKRVYLFSSTTASYSGALKMYYFNSQLNGLNASNLKLLLHNGTSWTLDNNSTSNTSKTTSTSTATKIPSRVYENSGIFLVICPKACIYDAWIRGLQKFTKLGHRIIYYEGIN